MAPGRSGGASRRRVLPSRIRAMIAEVSAERGIPAEKIRTMNGVAKVREARWEVWARLAQPGFSIKSIADAWPCNHTTILHGLTQHAAGAAAMAGTRKCTDPD